MQGALTGRRHRLEVVSGRLAGVSPLARLAGGYAYAADGNGKPVVSVRQVKPGDALAVTVMDGKILAQVRGTEDRPAVRQNGGQDGETGVD